VRGPSLVGIFGQQVPLKSGGTAKVDDDFLRKSIVDPMTHVVAGFDPIMPSFRGQIDEEGLNMLIAYIKSMKPVASSRGVPER
jgi:cytochrome c oxidase subunit 2